MTNPEETNRQEQLSPKEAKELIITIFDKALEQSGLGEQQKDVARSYLEQEPEEIDITSGLSSEQTKKRQEQKDKLEQLKAVLALGRDLDEQLDQQMLPLKLLGIVNNLANNPNLPGFQMNFFKELIQVSVPESSLIPYARFVLQTAEKIYDDSKREALRKAKLALEIFIGETDEKEVGFSLVKAIFSALKKSHGIDDISELFAEAEFTAFCNIYGLTEEERRQLQEVLQLAETEEDNTREERELQELKDEILTSFFAGDSDAAEKRAKLDLFLLTLAPDSESDHRLSQLMQTAPDPRYAEMGRLDPEAPTKKQQFEKLVEDWITDFEARQKVNLTQKQVRQLKTYFRQYRDTLDSYRLGFIRRSYMMPQSVVNEMQQFDNSLIQAAIMISSNNEFFFREYFKGKVVELMMKKDAETKKKGDESPIEKCLRIVRGEEGKGASFKINYQDLQREIFKDIRQMLFFALRSHEDPYAFLYNQVASSMYRMKGIVKSNVQLGGLDKKGHEGVVISFQFEELVEMNMGGYRELVAQHKYNSTYAHIVGTYLARAESFAKLYAGLSEFAKKAESGNAEEILKAAQAISNEQLDLFFLESPIIKYAISSYIRFIKNYLSANGGVLTPDILQRPTYGKKTIDMLLEDDIKSVFPMTDQEKDIYLSVAKALAIASGDLTTILANTLPPLDTIIREKLPQKLQDKIKNSQPLSIEEVKLVTRELNMSLHDFPFRGLLMAMNPLKWLFGWVNADDYNNYLLGYVPMMPGKEALGPFDMFKISQKIRDAIYYGVDDDVARYFREGWIVPVLELNNLTPNMSLQRLLGWRTHSFIFRHEDVEISIIGGEQKIDGPKTFEKLLQRSPMLAYQFVVVGQTKYMNIAVDWGGKAGLSETEKKAYIKKILEFCYENHPTFFTQNEERRFFRRDELSFNEELQTRIADELGTEPKDDGYWLFLSGFERSDRLVAESQPSRFGDTNWALQTRSRIVFSRMIELFTALETGLYEHKLRHPDGRPVSIKDFILNPENDAYKPIRDILVGKIGKIGKQQSLYGLQGSPEDLLKQFIKFAKMAFYDDDSVYNRNKFSGFLYEKGKGKSILEYYTTLVVEGKMLNPFDWSYMGDTDVWFQRTGLNMIARNVAMFADFLGYSSKMLNTANAVKDIIRIRHPEKGMELAKKALDSFEGTFMKLMGSYGEATADKAAWMTMAYLMQAFTPNRLRDVPIFGMLPVLESWATLMNPDDQFKVNAWTANRRKELFDYAQNRPWQQRIISSKNIGRGLYTKEVGVEKRKIKIFSKEVEIKIPQLLLRAVPSLSVAMDELYSGKGAKDFSATSLRHFLKIERHWIATNLFLTIAVVGLFLITLEAIREGIKEAEIN